MISPFCRSKADAITQTVYSHILPLDKTVQRGDAIFVVGNPFMLDANLNEGHISSVSRKIQWDDGEDIPYFGVDAGVNPGNSGGALYNADGELIGVPGASMRGATGLRLRHPGHADPQGAERELLRGRLRRRPERSSITRHARRTSSTRKTRCAPRRACRPTKRRAKDG